MEGLMNAIVFTEIGKYEYKQIPIPKIQNPDEVLIKVEVASICGTDLHILNVPQSYPGVPGIVIGHEYVGTIVEIGENVTEFATGDRVVLDPNVYCGECFHCKKGNFNMCENMRILGCTENGGFCEYSVAPQKMLVKISQELSLDLAVYAEPLTCIVSAVSKVRLIPGESVLVLGAGPIGLYFVQMFKANGAGKVLVSEVSEFRTEYAYKCGADRVINPQKENLKEETLNETGRYGVDVVVDAVGILAESAIDCVRKKGRILLFGMNSSRTVPISQFKVVSKEVQIFGTNIGLNTLPSTVSLLESGLLDDKLRMMITHRLPLENFGIGLEALKAGEALEVLLYP